MNKSVMISRYIFKQKPKTYFFWQSSVRRRWCVSVILAARYGLQVSCLRL